MASLGPRVRLVISLLALLSASTASGSPRKRLVVVTHTAGFRHESIPVAERVLLEMGTKSGLFEVSYCRDAADVRRMLVPSFLSGIDAVFFANTTGDLGIPDLPAFLAWVRSGKVFAGAHAASDTYHPSGTVGTGYVDMLGAEFASHGAIASAEALVENATHPSVAHLADRWIVNDELYELVTSPRPRAHVVLALDRHPDDGHPEAGQPGDFPLAWYSRYGDGAVFYTALGHRDEVWLDPDFQKHVLGALRWALAVTDRSSVSLPAAASRPGANGTFFRTDLWLHNGSYVRDVTATLRLRCAAGLSCPSGPRTLVLAPRATRLLPDVVGTFLEAPGAFGAIDISWPSAEGPVTASARVATAHPAGGTSGAAVPALPAASARTRSLLVGLASSGADRSAGFRTNAGVSNPAAESVAVTLRLFDEAGRPLGERTVIAPGGGTVQLDDVFSAVGAGSTATSAAALVVTSTVPVNAYATVIDNVSGDSVLLVAGDDAPPPR